MYNLLIQIQLHMFLPACMLNILYFYMISIEHLSEKQHRVVYMY